jgi:hypothetical protein
VSGGEPDVRPGRHRTRFGFPGGALLRKYVEGTNKYRLWILAPEVCVGAAVFMFVPYLFGVTFLFDYGRLTAVPIVLGICWLDVWARGGPPPPRTGPRKWWEF